MNKDWLKLNPEMPGYIELLKEWFSGSRSPMSAIAVLGTLAFIFLITLTLLLLI